MPEIKDEIITLQGLVSALGGSALGTKLDTLHADMDGVEGKLDLVNTRLAALADDATIETARFVRIMNNVIVSNGDNNTAEITMPPGCNGCYLYATKSSWSSGDEISQMVVSTDLGGTWKALTQGSDMAISWVEPDGDNLVFLQPRNIAMPTVQAFVVALPQRFRLTFVMVNPGGGVARMTLWVIFVSV
jgi:hypothetical protein